jgi:predicted ATP-dependent endonuclease of OLD family
MKIQKFRIKNYKSIIDSGDCYLEKDLTIFAGKNESGKSSILEALRDFNAGIAIAADAKPLKNSSSLPEINVVIEYEKEELLKYFKAISIHRDISGNRWVSIIKRATNEYIFTDEDLEFFDLNADKDATSSLKVKIEALYKKIKSDYETIFKRNGVVLFNLNLTNIVSTKAEIEKYNKDNKNVPKSKPILPAVSVAHSLNITQVIRHLDELQNYLSNGKTNWSHFNRTLPNFILFSSFDDVIPNSIKYEDLEKNEFIKDLGVVSNINIPLIKSDDIRNKTHHQDELNLKLNSEYSQFWCQDLSKIRIEWDTNILYFWIDENGTLYRPGERSKGKQWHMSFYVKVTARSLDGKVNVILIDEPGLYLHAMAQKDIYSKLLNRGKKVQIVFTTHSPYLINKDELHRVRLVFKNNIENEGTIVENKIHARADKETLTPILTAIGLEISDGIQNVNQERNVVIEGPSDYFYLQGFKLLIESSNINPIFGGGAGNMGNIGSILSGWGCKVIYLYDKDQGKKDGEKNLSRHWYVSKNLIQSVRNDGGSIEDVFETNDFKKFVLDNEKANISGLNSEYLIENKLEKVLLAKQFNALCHKGEVKLSKETQLRVKDLFEKLKVAFDKYNELRV